MPWGRVLRCCVNAVEWWSAFLLALMVVLVSLGVFFRYALGAALVWYDEFASYLLVWLTFSGCVAASYRRQHVQLDLVVNKLGPRAKRRVEMVSECFVFGFQVVLCRYGALLAGKLGDETSVSVDWIKMSWVYSVLPVTGGMMLVISAIEILHRLSREWRPVTLDVPEVEQKETDVRWSGSSLE